MQQRHFDQQQRQLKQKIATVERFKAKANKASMAQSMLKKIEKIEKIEAPESAPPTMNLPFAHVTSSGKIVLTVTDVSKSFGARHIFSHASFEVARHQRVALVAANGVGKSTLLSIIMGKLAADSGTITLGHNAVPALFEQEQDQILNKNKNVLDEVSDSCNSSETRQRVRPFLGAFLCPGDDDYKKISVLSGGEKNRVAMVKVLLAQANFLILDEPTNHLDLQSKKALLEALKQFPGTILFVSHDRAFLDDLATTIVELTPQGTYTYQGNYESFLYAKAQKAAQAAQPTPQASAGKQTVSTQKQTTGAKPQETPKLTGKEAYEMRKKISAAEKKVEKLEAQLVVLKEELATFDYDSTKNLAELKKKIQTTEADIKTTFALWEEISKKV
jgi:ATP-binding cassette subfamily F protein 3